MSIRRIGIGTVILISLFILKDYEKKAYSAECQVQGVPYLTQKAHID
jgi:hypothetical protein